MNAGFIIAKYIKVPNPLHILSYKKRAVSSALFSYYSIGNIDNATRPFFVSISSTHTLTICPTDTTSNGCFTYCLLSLEICTKPSCFTPTSTKAPKSTTLRTVPSSSIPRFKSSNFKIPFFRSGLGNSSLMSRSGLMRASIISTNVGSPTPVSWDNLEISTSSKLFCNCGCPTSSFDNPRLFNNNSTFLYCSG
ncbi:hypothetical protein protein [Bacillus cereus G9241]|nr:hypothetical protein protein [Bacillus cereus G9241]